MNNDELQKAIDDITKDSAIPAADGLAENDQLADELAGVAPVAPAPEAAVVPDVDLGAAPAPEIPDTPGMPPVEAKPAEINEEPVMAAPIAEPAVERKSFVEETAAPVAAPAETGVRDDATLNEALKELCPLLDKVELPVKEKFDITMKVGEPAQALGYAKQMTDESEKAAALLEIVNKLK